MNNNNSCIVVNNSIKEDLNIFVTFLTRLAQKTNQNCGSKTSTNYNKHNTIAIIAIIQLKQHTDTYAKIQEFWK